MKLCFVTEVAELKSDKLASTAVFKDNKQQLVAIHLLVELIEARKRIAEGSVNVEKYLQSVIDEQPKSSQVRCEDTSIVIRDG